MTSSKSFLLFCFAAFCCVARGVQAHFPWLISDAESRIILVFGESPEELAGPMPDSIAGAKLRTISLLGKSTWLATTQVASPDLIALRSEQPLENAAMVVCEVDYGTYRGSALRYTAIYQLSDSPIEGPVTGDGVEPTGFSASVQKGSKQIEVRVAFDGKPLDGSEVKLMAADGSESAIGKTDANGLVAFANKDVEPGLNAIMVSQSRDLAAAGEVTKQSNYLTLTFNKANTMPAMQFAELPFEITSFGAARVGDMVYAYGGHTGDAHSYSAEEQSNKLLALDLNHPEKAWQVLATGDRLQGLALVPYESKIISIGGFTAKNAAGEEQDLESQARVRAFDTVSKQWSDLPPLPAGRSSHDAAILGSTIYVVGGWAMTGNQETEWHKTALSLDLSQENPQWNELPEPPFVRRALAVVAHDDKIYVIGGMDQSGGPTRETSVFNPATQSWSTGPELLGKTGMAGFGAAGWSIDDKLVVSTYEGEIAVLQDDGSAWRSLGKTKDSRFFHRLLPLDATRLISIGGANMEEGKFLGVEVIDTE